MACRKRIRSGCRGKKGAMNRADTEAITWVMACSSHFPGELVQPSMRRAFAGTAGVSPAS
jgi:hypothetical protein